MRIREILTVNTDLEHGRIDDAIWCIEASVESAKILEGSGNPKESRDELTALHRATAVLLRKIHTLSTDTKMALDLFVSTDGFEPQTSKHRRLKQTSQFPFQGGEGLRRLQFYAEAIKKAASNTLAEIKVKRKVKPGGKPNFKGRSIAFHLRETFEDFDVPVTSTDSGPYMEILDIVFSELLPTDEQQAYIRHGKWAVSLKDIRGTTFAAIVDNGNE